jgi:hypothetical protein
MSKHRTAAADETAVAVLSSKAQLRSLHVIQHTVDAPALFLQLFNNASPTVGTTAPNKVMPIPPGRTGEKTYIKENINTEQGGFPFSTALSFAVTTTHDGSTGPDAGDEPEVIIDYTPAP